MKATPALRIESLFPKAANLGDQTCEHLRELILRREITGGTELPEGRLAEHLRVSRTPMRETLVRLVGEGLLERTNDRAYRVRTVSTREFFECMQLRELLECHALDRAIPLVGDADLATLRSELLALSDSGEDDMEHWRYDNRFHAFFARAAGQEILADTIARMRVVARLFRISSALHRQTEIDSEHLAILEAVERRDVAAAKGAMLSHLHNLQDHVRRAIAAELRSGQPIRIGRGVKSLLAALLQESLKVAHKDPERWRPRTSNEWGRHTARMLAARTGPMPSTSRNRSGVASMTSNTLSPKARTSFLA